MKKRTALPESLLSELGLPVEHFDLIELASNCGAFLEKAARRNDLPACRRALELILWFDEHSKLDERYLYVCQDIMRKTIEDEDLRSRFASVLNGRTFSQLRGYIEYLTSSADASAMATLVNRS